MPENNNTERRTPDFNELSFDKIKLIELLAQKAFLENSITPIAQYNSAHLQELLAWSQGLKSNVVELRRPQEMGITESNSDLECLWLVLEDIAGCDQFAAADLEEKFGRLFNTNRGFWDSVQDLRDRLDEMMGWSEDECVAEH